MPLSSTLEPSYRGGRIRRQTDRLRSIPANFLLRSSTPSQAPLDRVTVASQHERFEEYNTCGMVDKNWEITRSFLYLQVRHFCKKKEEKDP